MLIHTPDSPQMNDAFRLRGSKSESMAMSHNIVATSLFLFGNDGKLIILDRDMLLHLEDSIVSDLIQAKFLLALGEPNPQLTPRRESSSWGKELFHLLATVA